jgi:hypothetical protein
MNKTKINNLHNDANNHSPYFHNVIINILKQNHQIKAQLFLQLELINKTLCSIILIKTKKAKDKIIKEISDNKNWEDLDINLKNFKQGKLFDLYVSMGKQICKKYLFRRRCMGSSFIKARIIPRKK